MTTLGKKELKLSLRTGCLRTARLRVAAVLGRLQDILPWHYESRLRDMEREGLREKFRGPLWGDERELARPPLARKRPMDRGALDEYADTMSLCQSDAVEALATGDWRRWAHMAQRFVAEHNLAIEENSADFRELSVRIGAYAIRGLSSLSSSPSKETKGYARGGYLSPTTLHEVQRHE